MSTHVNPSTGHKRLTKCGCLRAPKRPRIVDPRPTLTVLNRRGKRKRLDNSPSVVYS